MIDQSGILDSSQREKLNDLYANHEKITTNEIVLLTTNNFYPDSSIENYSLRKFDSMDIGQNGVLIVFSAPMRKVRIATGYGSKKILTDNVALKIIDSLMIPQFKQQKFFEGLWNGSTAIINFLEKPESKMK